MEHLYIYKTKSKHEELKYGIYKGDRHKRITDGNTYYGYNIELLCLYKINKTNNYKLEYKNYDTIISNLGRSKEKVKQIENIFNIELVNLSKIYEYINEYNNGKEIINKSGLNILLNVIETDFKILGLNVIKYSDIELQKIQDYINNYSKNKLGKKIQLENDEFNKTISKYKKHKLAIQITDIITPHEHQLYVLWNSLYNFLRDKKGLLLWSCGLGKTIMALLICYKFQFKNILIGLPSKNLLLQWNNEIIKHLNIKPILCYGESINKHLLETITTRPINIVLTTYHSSIKIVKICKKLNFKFDIKIGDEAHHLVTIKKGDNKQTFDKFHLIPAEYSLFMTATQKNIITMDSIIGYNIFTDKDTFGDIIDKKSIKWAIDNKKITDYNIICIYNQMNELDTIFNNIDIKYLCSKNYKFNKKELFMSAYFALQALNDDLVSHILIYANKCESALIIRKIIDKLIMMNIFKNINTEIEKDINNFYNKELYSNNDIYHNNINIQYCDYCNEPYLFCEYHINDKSQCYKDKTNCKIKCKKYLENETPIFHTDDEQVECELCKFKKSKYGIINCVYIFGEGFDLPCLNGVVIGEKMSSEIRIVQSCLRPNRLDKKKLEKKAYIIIPTNLNNIDDKIITVVREMGNNDDTIEQKINLVSINNQNNTISYIKDKELKIHNNNELLNKLKIELYSRYCFGLDGLSLEKEYNIYKQIYTEKYNMVKDYKNDKEVKIKNPDIYFSKYWKGWFDYLGINTSSWIPELYKWKEYCQEKNIKSINDYKLIVEIDIKLPPEPEYFYSGFTNFEKELELLSDDFYFF